MNMGVLFKVPIIAVIYVWCNLNKGLFFVLIYSHNFLKALFEQSYVLSKILINLKQSWFE